MTALTEALTAAQRRAIGAVEKAYVAGLIEKPGALKLLDSCGATDVTEQTYLFAALDTVKLFGGEAPSEPANSTPPDKPASDKQRVFIARLADERGYPAPDLAGVTSVQASEIITQLQNGSFDPAAWEIPF